MYENFNIERIQNEFESHLKYAVWDSSNAQEKHHCRALMMLLQDQIILKWIETQRKHYREKAKRVYYLSTEYLPGPLLMNNMLNLNLQGAIKASIQLDWDKIRSVEEDPGLGNAGLGRLASCFLDSLATHEVPCIAYGLRYHYGTFFQKIVNGSQVVRPDDWIKDQSIWCIAQRDQEVSVKFGGKVNIQKINGRTEFIWQPSYQVLGLPYVIFITGYNTKVVNSLYLWESKSVEFLDDWNMQQCNYTENIIQQIEAEKLTYVFYPREKYLAGQELRFKQQYFFVACSIHDIVNRFESENQNAYHKFPDKVAIQLNDTNPVLSIPEFMRILVDEKKLPWEMAWEITQKTFSYTNHTLMAEGMEKWPVYFFQKFLPRHLQIIYEINRRFMNQIHAWFPGDMDRLQRMSLVEEWPEKQIRMAHLANVGCHKVNGVSSLHTEILKRIVFEDFHEIYPNKILNITNGITQRRWLLVANPELSELLFQAIKKDWAKNLFHLEDLLSYSENAEFRECFQKIKFLNKQRLAALIEKEVHTFVDPAWVFDVQAKRIHEYKRQFLNLLHIIYLYVKIKAKKDTLSHPYVFIFAGKATPSYLRGRLIIKMIHAVAEKIKDDPEVSQKLQIIFLPNYRVSLAERIIPAADISEQLSTSGKEASGTSLFKFALNGAHTVCTLDGASIELANRLTDENVFSFGMTVKDNLEQIKDNPAAIGKRNLLISTIIAHRDYEFLREGIRLIKENFFSPKLPGLFDSLLYSIFHEGDPYYIIEDFKSYAECKEKVDQLYCNQAEWTRKAILNLSRMGEFSSDVSVMNYCKKIWNV